MKKIAVFVIAAVVLFSFAVADVDLSAMSYDELVTLSKQVSVEIMSRPEWEEITVPSGQWVVGVDIPAGFYSIFPAVGGGYLRIRNESGKLLVTQGVRKDSDAFWKYELKEGYKVEVDDGSLIFGPAKSLGF